MMMILESAYQSVIKSGVALQMPVILVCLLCALYHNRESAYRLLLLMALTVFTNIILKCLLREPLPAGVGDNNYANPSGHTQFAVVFYGAFAYEFLHERIARLWIALFSLLMILSEIFIIRYHGYHTWEQILNALIIGGLLLLIYYGYLVRYSIRVTAAVIAVSAVFYTILQTWINDPISLAVNSNTWSQTIPYALSILCFYFPARACVKTLQGRRLEIAVIFCLSLFWFFIDANALLTPFLLPKGSAFIQGFLGGAILFLPGYMLSGAFYE